jgi:hypothetical protein
LTDLARQLNTFAANVKAHRQGSRSKQKSVSEAADKYVTDSQADAPLPLLTDEVIEWLEAISNA